MEKVDVMVIDDNEGICWILQQALALCNLNCIVANDGLQGIEGVDRHQPRLVIIDIKLGAMNGFEVARLIRRAHPEIKILFVTGYKETIDNGEQFRDKNILGILGKPFDLAYLLELVGEVFE